MKTLKYEELGFRFDQDKYRLDTLCEKLHDYEDTGRSLRYIYRGQVTGCVLCARERIRNWKTENKEKSRQLKASYRERHREEHLARRRKTYAAIKPDNSQINKEKAERIAKERKEFQVLVAALNVVYNINTDIYTLRKLCKRKHEYLDSGLSLATGGNVFLGGCVECQREKRAKSLAGMNYMGRKKKAICIPFTKDELDERLALFDSCCAYCGVKLNNNPKDCKKKNYRNWEHMIPLIKGGFHAIFNLVPSCKGCNGSKGELNVYEWYLDANPKPTFYSKERANLIRAILNQGGGTTG